MPDRDSSDRIARLLRTAGGVLFSRTFWIGIFAIAAFWLAIYAVFNWWIMPAYTRHGDQVRVPDFRSLRLSEAIERIETEGFELGQVLRYYDPEQSAMVVLRQDPRPGAAVKPGRRIYLTINSGNAPRIEVPDLEFVSMREARSRLASHQLSLGNVFEDSLPAPFKNTVTRQRPSAGDSVAIGSMVDIWISTGLGSSLVTVPDIVDMSAADAERTLLQSQLRLVVLEDPEVPPTRLDTIARQNPPAGTEVRSGSEIHAFANMAEMPFYLEEGDSLSTSERGMESR